MQESDFNSRDAYVQARLQFLREQLADLGELLHFSDPDGDPEEELAFLEHIYVLESAPSVTHAHQLIANGVSLPAPDDLTDKQLHEKLWEIFHKLAELRVFLENTNHLTDRALYQELWTQTLNEFTWDMSHNCQGALHIDLCGSGSEADTANWLRFYATDDDRQQWLEDFPDEAIPDKDIPAVDRDQHLPKPHMEAYEADDDLDDFCDPGDWDDFPG